MIIWTLALLLFLVFGYAGYSLGGIRHAVWFVGLLVATKLAPALGHIFYSPLKLVGLKNPVEIWLLGPFIAFVLIVIVFMVIGQAVHQKVDVHYKYKAGDLMMGLFNRLNARLGVCMAMANAAVYLILISWVIYIFSYWTTQMVTGDEGSWSVRMLNVAGHNLESSGMIKVAAAIDKMPENYFQAADIVGLIYHNDLLESRLSRYPGLLDLGQRQEFQDMGNDKEFTELRQRQPPFTEVINYPKVQAILDNPDELEQIWGIITPNLTDLQNYLLTGASTKYDSEKILGRWNYNFNDSLNAFKRSKTNIGYQEMLRTKQAMGMIFNKTMLIAAPEPTKLVIMHDLGKVVPATVPKAPPTVELQTFKGTWSSDGGNYQLSFPDRAAIPLSATVDGNLMTVTGDVYPMVFEREN